MSLTENLREIKNSLPEEVILVAVSKTKPAEDIQALYNAGHRDFGENKVQELAGKYKILPKDIHWHLIGHLQKNKVKYIAPFVHLIHSVDSEDLLKEINKQAQKYNRVIPCLLQIHIAEEETKFGMDEEEAKRILGIYQSEFQNVEIVGLMGMATFTDDENQIRKEFKTLKYLFEKFKTCHPEQFDRLTVTLVERQNSKLTTLSMGMSGDYKIAVEEGSNMVRVGSLIFGERNYI